VQPDTEFGSFVAARSARLLRVAYLLTRDWALAEDLLQTALAKAWRAWGRIETDPEAYVRRILVTTYSSWWRQRWLHERPIGQVPDRAHADDNGVLDEREQMLQALGRLPQRQRAVLVLRYYEDMSEAEIAETLGIARGTVKSIASVGLANLRSDMVFRGEPSAHHVRLAAVALRVKTRRRRALAVVAAACVVALAIIIGYAVSPNRRSTPHPQPLTTASPVQFGGLPEYHLGTRIVQAVTVTRDQPHGHISWIPPDYGGDHFAACHGVTTSIRVTYSIRFAEGKGGSDCSMLTNDKVVKAAAVRPAYGQRSVTLDIQLEYAEDLSGRRVPIPAEFSLSYGVAKSVEWSDYVFPPRPQRVPPLASMLKANTSAVVSDPADPMAPRTVRVRQPQQLSVLADGTGPTRLHISMGVIEILDYRKWS
jgi:RNA polymerase sigma-70 factor (sigma-E family)